MQVVRGLGLIGDGVDPMLRAMSLTDPFAARDFLRGEEQRRLTEIRQIVLATTNNVPIRVGDVVDGGRQENPTTPSLRGVVAGTQTRQGQATVSFPRRDKNGEELVDSAGRRLWDTNDDAVQGVVLLRKGEQSLPALLTNFKNRAEKLHPKNA